MTENVIIYEASAQLGTRLEIWGTQWESLCSKEAKDIYKT